MIVERTGADVWTFLLSHDLLWKYRKNLNVVTQVIYDDVSSSKIRLFLRRGKSIRYLLPQAVVSYMAEHQLVSRDAKSHDMLARTSLHADHVSPRRGLCTLRSTASRQRRQQSL